MIHVFTGPTLSRSAPELAVPQVRAYPPAEHGDLFAESIRDGDTVVLIDGVYHQTPALRHKEILAAMGRGVRVIGAASIGALRAAELDQFGMTGVGAVYEAYAHGDITGDDEVAVGQAPDGAFEALTWPMVNVRHVLQLARSARVLDEHRVRRLLEALHGIYYPQRTMAAVRAVCNRKGEAAFARWMAARLFDDPHFGNVKRADALRAVDVALGHDLPPGWRPACGVWDSAYFRTWSNAHARTVGEQSLTRDRVLYRQVADPTFRATWSRYLEYRSLHPADGLALPLSERLAAVTDNSLPADRVFRPALDLRDGQSVAILLDGETGKDRLAVARCAQALDRLRRSTPGFSVEAVRTDLTRQLLLRVWQCPQQELDAEASSRGLVSAARAVHEAKRLVPGLLEEFGTSDQEAVRGDR